MSNERPSEAAATTLPARLDAFLDGRTIGTSKFGLHGPVKLHWRGPGYDEGWDDLTTEEVEQLLTLLRETLLADLPVEWGVRFPSGAVQQCDDEDEAKRYALAYNGARPDLPTLVVRKAATGWEIPADAIEQCREEHPTNPTVVPCVLDKGHPEDHFSTTGCAGSEISWTRYVHPADRTPQDPRPVCRHEYAGHEGPCERKACGKPYRDRHGDMDTCSFPPNHEGSCW